MNSVDEFDSGIIICSTIYLLSFDTAEKRFDDLVQCAARLGLSTECSLLYAHLGAATVETCGNACQAEVIAGTAEATNLAPPTCNLTPCMDCPSSWNIFFDDMAGLSLERAGIAEKTAKPCSKFAHIEHDACVGASSDPVGRAWASERRSASPSPELSRWMANALNALAVLSFLAEFGG